MNRRRLRVYIFTCAVSFSALSQTAYTGKPVKESAVRDYINLYQRYISGARGATCAMYPSCSTFGLMTFNERPFWEAMALTADRLTRCSHDRKYYAETFESGGLRLLNYPPYKTPPRELAYRPTRYLYADSFVSQDSVKLFITRLINRNHYDLALLEIEKALYFKHDADSSYYLNKLLCYDALDKEENGIFDYENTFPPAIKRNERVVIRAAKLYYNADNDEAALKMLEGIQFKQPEMKYKKLVLQGIIETRQRNFNSAKSLFRESSDYGNGVEFAGKNIQFVEQLESIRPKSPATARFLSILPGAGYAYTKNYQNALTSFAINSLLAFATYSSIKKENYGVAAIMGIFSLSFYAGNILGAGNSAERYNQYIINKGVEQLAINNQIINY